MRPRIEGSHCQQHSADGRRHVPLDRRTSIGAELQLVWPRRPALRSSTGARARAHAARRRCSCPRAATHRSSRAATGTRPGAGRAHLPERNAGYARGVPGVRSRPSGVAKVTYQGAVRGGQLSRGLAGRPHAETGNAFEARDICLLVRRRRVLRGAGRPAADGRRVGTLRRRQLFRRSKTAWSPAVRVCHGTERSRTGEHSPSRSRAYGNGPPTSIPRWSPAASAPTRAPTRASSAATAFARSILPTTARSCGTAFAAACARNFALKNLGFRCVRELP